MDLIRTNNQLQTNNSYDSWELSNCVSDIKELMLRKKYCIFHTHIKDVEMNSIIFESSFKIRQSMLGVVVHTMNLCTREAGVGGLCGLETSLVYIIDFRPARATLRLFLMKRTKQRITTPSPTPQHTQG